LRPMKAPTCQPGPLKGPIKLSAPETHGFWEIPICFEDAHVLALDKPSGLLTSPARQNPEQPSLIQLLHAGIAAGKPWVKEHGVAYLMNAHRLDVETSGVALLAKSKPVLIALANLFGSEKPVREYLALASGTPPEDRFEVDAPLAPHPVKDGLLCVDRRRGKRARTVFVVRERFDGWTLLECQPLTERPHQIRAHLRHLRLPLAGDAPYGGKPLLLSQLKPDYRLKRNEPERPLLGRAALHLGKLALAHPVTGEPLSIGAPWPKDLSVAVKYLRRYAPNA